MDVQDVIDEKAALDVRKNGLHFLIFGTAAFNDLPANEQKLLTRQWKAMEVYSIILGQRIEAFAGFVE